MAKQVGPIFLEGTLGGINYYFLEGEALARRAGGGFTREAIKNGENMVKIRENNSEFAACSKVNKTFKAAIQPLLSGYKDGTLHSRLMQLFLKIKDCDLVSERGQRSVARGISDGTGKQLLKEFIFTPQRPQILSCPYEFHWNSLTFTVRELRVDQAPFPEGADHMEIGVGLIRFNFESLAYEQVLAPPAVIARDFEGNFLQIGCNKLPGGEGTLFAMVRIAFYQKVNEEGDAFGNAHSFGIAVVSVWDDEEGA